MYAPFLRRLGAWVGVGAIVATLKHQPLCFGGGFQITQIFATLLCWVFDVCTLW